MSSYVHLLPFVGSYPPSISNSLKASKLHINQPMPEIEEFKQRYCGLMLVGLIIFVMVFHINY